MGKRYIENTNKKERKKGNNIFKIIYILILIFCMMLAIYMGSNNIKKQVNKNILKIEETKDENSKYKNENIFDNNVVKPSEEEKKAILKENEKILIEENKKQKQDKEPTDKEELAKYLVNKEKNTLNIFSVKVMHKINDNEYIISLVDIDTTKVVEVYKINVNTRQITQEYEIK